MKLLFIIPPPMHYLEASANERLDKNREHRPTLGVLAVASYIEKHRPQHAIRIIDAPSEDYTLDDVVRLFKEYDPDVVGFTAMTFTLLDVLEAVRAVKAAKPDVRTVLGGWHPTYYPKETLMQPGVDVVVGGEGEQTFAEFCDALEANCERPELEKVAGLAYKTASGEFAVNPPRPKIEDLDSLPIPNYNLVDLNRYQHVLGSGGVTLALQSSRGCPFACTFCDIRRSRFRQRSSESVVDELEHWTRQGIRSFFFVDDNFVVNRRWTIETCKMIVERKLDIEFKISGRIDRANLEMYEWLARAGCSRINFGVESFEQVNLDYLIKGTKVEQIGAAFAMARQAGLKAFAYMIVGFPRQNEWEMYRELVHLARVRADFASFAVLSAYPRTPLYERLLQDGVFPRDFWREFAERPTADFTMPLVSRRYNREKLRRIQVRMTQFFYFNPLFLGRAVLSIRSAAQLKNYARVALNLARRVRR